jgi:DNA polymerase I-like protein with 3'-5' exonuclease and polymerase domains
VIEKKLRLFVDLITNFNVTLRKEFKQNGYILNYFKRRIYPEKNYALVNNYIQSTAADIIIRKILKIRELLTKYNPLNSIVLQNHDSVLLNFCKYDIENTDIVLKIKEILEESENGLFNKVSLKYGTNWRDLT